jgi:uncharacterized protein (TIGR01244 family)
VGLVLLSAFAFASLGDEGATTPFDLRNGRQVDEQLLVGGQPSAAQLDAMAETGLRSVVNLRGVGEDGTWDEGSHLEKLGLSYLHLPIASAADLTPELAGQLAAWLEDPEHLPVLVHCASGNRVGALFALKAFHVDGQGAAEALEVGTQHGLMSLAPKVEAMLAEPASAQPEE